MKVMRVGKWFPPPVGILKINTDGSSKGNPGPARIGGVGRDSTGSVVFLFSSYEGTKTVNLMEGLAIFSALEQAYALGWRKVICESDSQVLVNFFKDRKVADVSW